MALHDYESFEPYGGFEGLAKKLMTTPKLSELNGGAVDEDFLMALDEILVKGKEPEEISLNASLIKELKRGLQAWTEKERGEMTQKIQQLFKGDESAAA